VAHGVARASGGGLTILGSAARWYLWSTKSFPQRSEKPGGTGSLGPHGLVCDVREPVVHRSPNVTGLGGISAFGAYRCGGAADLRSYRRSAHRTYGA